MSRPQTLHPQGKQIPFNLMNQPTAQDRDAMSFLTSLGVVQQGGDIILTKDCLRCAIETEAKDRKVYYIYYANSNICLLSTNHKDNSYDSKIISSLYAEEIKNLQIALSKDVNQDALKQIATETKYPDLLALITQNSNCTAGVLQTVFSNPLVDENCLCKMATLLKNHEAIEQLLSHSKCSDNVKFLLAKNLSQHLEAAKDEKLHDIFKRVVNDLEKTPALIKDNEALLRSKKTLLGSLADCNDPVILRLVACHASCVGRNADEIRQLIVKNPASDSLVLQKVGNTLDLKVLHSIAVHPQFNNSVVPTWVSQYEAAILAHNKKRYALSRNDGIRNQLEHIAKTTTFLTTDDRFKLLLTKLLILDKLDDYIDKRLHNITVHDYVVVKRGLFKRDRDEEITKQKVKDAFSLKSQMLSALCPDAASLITLLETSQTFNQGLVKGRMATQGDYGDCLAESLKLVSSMSMSRSTSMPGAPR